MDSCWTFLDWVRLGRQNGTAFLDYYDDIVDHTIMDATPFRLPDGACGIEDRHGHTIRLPPGPWRSASELTIFDLLFGHFLKFGPEILAYVVIMLARLNSFGTLDLKICGNKQNILVCQKSPRRRRETI